MKIKVKKISKARAKKIAASLAGQIGEIIKSSPARRESAPKAGGPGLASNKNERSTGAVDRANNTPPDSQFNNVLTASRMNCFNRCLRQHFWQFEIGLRKIKVGVALLIGAAWARSMEVRWKGGNFDAAMAAALCPGVNLDRYNEATVAGLLSAYYDHYGPREDFVRLDPEVRFGPDVDPAFVLEVDGVLFSLEGKIDGLGDLMDHGDGMLEAKTTGDSVAPDSGYWDRLAFNTQLFQYVLAARVLGRDPRKVFYDVTRKPSIQPKMVDDLDPEGKKIVVDRDGNRVYNQKGKFAGEPRQSEDKERGYVIKRHFETPEEFSDRLYYDAMERPDFYFARREVSILEREIEMFQRQRLQIARTILFLRSTEVGPARDPDAWPRTVSESTCDFCSFKTFCLQNQTVDPSRPPEGFEVNLNPELKENELDAAGAEDPSASTTAN